MSKFRVKSFVCMCIVTILVLSVFGAGSALAADEGYIISKNSDYSTSDLEFVQTSDTIYMKIWSNVVGNNPKTKKWEIVDSQSIKKSGALTPDDTTPGGTRTFVASSSASNYATGDATLTMKLQSGNKKYIVQKTITITGAGNQPPPEPSWINPDNTDDSTPKITWQAVSDPNGDTVYYSIKIGTTSGSTDVLQETSTGINAYYDVTSPLDDDTYYVNVRANDGELYSNWHEETMVVDTSGGPQPSPEVKITSAYVNDNSNTECFNALATDGGTSYSLSKGAHIDAPFQTLSDVVSVNSATLYYDSWGSLSGSWGIYLKDSKDGNTICSADPAPEDSSETRNSINCNSLSPTQLENGVWLFIKNNDNKKAEKINLDYVYLYVDYTSLGPITEMWVDDDYTLDSYDGHTWGVDAFNRTQAAIYAADEINLTTVNILPGNYSEIITIDRPVKLQGEISGEGDYLSNITNILGDKWAVICVSANDMGDSDQSPDRDCFPAQGLQAYYALQSKGYDDDHIILMLWHDDEQAYINQNDDVICEDNPNTSSTIENDGDDIDEWININYFTNGNWKNELYGPDGIKDTSDDPVIDVDNRAVTKAALKQQITQLASQVTPDDEVLIYIVNHGRKYGTPERCQVYFEDDSAGISGKYLDAATLDSWLDQVICKRMTILLDMCRTQNFAESDLGFTQESNRLIIGASGDIDNIAHAWYQARYNHPTDGSHFAGSWFFNPFWERIAAADTVQQAYQYAMEASDQMAEDHPYPYQYPFLLDKLRDVGSYSLVPYDGNVITFMTGAQDGAEICDINLSAGSSGTGIKIENKYVDFTQGLVNDNSQAYTDITTNANSDDDLFFNFFPSTQAIGDSVMIGSKNIFSRIYIVLSTSGSSDGSFVVECAVNRDEWVEATIQTDTTNYLTQSGEIIFKPPLDWACQCHIHPVSDEKSEYTYWMRLRLIGTYTNVPIGDYIDLSYYSEGTRNITNNNFINNNYGIYLKGITTQVSGRGPIEDCLITGNDFYVNNYAIYLETCENILIYHNNFLDNTATNQVLDSNPGLNDWYHIVLLEGNYWSDYSGTDTNSDGIGDTNIPHPMVNYDYYPFIDKDGWES